MVDDEEVLFRRIRYEWLSRDETGKVRLSSQAFADKGQQPSVNRATITPEPERTQFEITDGVAQLIAEEVRAIDSVIQNPLAPPAQHVPYRLDVVERPIYEGNPEGEPENLAHAQVESAPDLENKSRFDKVKDALSRLAQTRPFVIEPRKP